MRAKTDAIQRSHPFRQFVLKVASRCNLACDYCYVYTGPDQSWRSQPLVMSAATIDALSKRIGEHMRTHELSSVQIGLHGGEPLLAGKGTLTDVITSVRAAAPPGARVDLAVQTNGLLLDEAFLALFARHQVRVGISLDGTRQANDRHRIRADSRASYADVVRRLRVLETASYRALFAGLLCTIDLANDPVETYQALLEFGPPTVDFLPPHGNWSRPPPRPPGAAMTPYADWLIAVFDHWYVATSGNTRIRLFDDVIHLLLGGSPATESIGAGVVGFAVVETDGAIEGADSLKSAYHGAARTGLTVWTNSFDEALLHPVIAAQQLGRAGLCATCRSCPVVGVCGGGQYAHRYRAGHGFGNPSVYCADLYRLIGHIADRVCGDLDHARSRRP
jgi:uncharacterized protein